MDAVGVAGMLPLLLVIVMVYEPGAEPVIVEELDLPAQPERAANAMAIAAAIASGLPRLVLLRLRPDSKPINRDARAIRGNTLRAAVLRALAGRCSDGPQTGQLSILTEALPPAPGAVDAIVMVPLTVPPEGTVTLGAVKEHVGRVPGVPLPL